MSRKDEEMRTVIPQGGGSSWASAVPLNSSYVSYQCARVLPAENDNSTIVSYDSSSDVQAFYKGADDANAFYNNGIDSNPSLFFASYPEAAAAVEEEETRRSEVDVVFCELFRVPKSGKTVKIRLPDRIAAYDVKAFFVSGSDWEEKEEKIVVSKPMYIEPMIPSVATEEDSCRAIVVNAKDDCELSVRIDGKDVKFERTNKGSNAFLKWKAIPGVHEVSASMPLSEAAKMAGYRSSRRMSDKVSRIVEPPGEEIILCQETRVLSKGKKYDLEIDALSVGVLPGIQEELKAVVHVAVDFQHSCCEQTSAKIVAACVAMSVGNDGDKGQACKAIINGEARLRSMYDSSRHVFYYYPGSSVNEWASAAAAQRLAKIDVPDAPRDVSEALAKIREMASDVLPHSKVSPSPMEAIYSSGKFSAASTSDSKAAADAVSGGSSMAIAEAAYAAACLLRSGRLDAGVEVANVVAKAMAPAMGGFHGTNDLLAYLVMVLALSEAGVVPSAGGTVVIDGEKMKVVDAVKYGGGSKIEAVDNAVAIRINRLKKIRLDEENPAVPIEVKLVGDSSKAVKAGRMARLVVRNVGGYKAGDVVVVRLPQCLSRMIGGGKQKKFQVDFEGKDEVSIDLVAHDVAKQKMAVVVRNMYDASRIGSAGLINVSVA